MTAERIVAVPIEGADQGFYITPDGQVLRAVVTHMRGKYRWVNVNQGGQQKKVAVHRLVAASFIPNPESKPQVNHKNGDKLDNRAENLEWVTPKENTQHAHRLGLVKHFKSTVVMLSLDGKPIRTFPSQKEAAEFLGKESKSSGISRCVKGHQKTAYGYRWKSCNE